jgi:hypothetical protein
VTRPDSTLRIDSALLGYLRTAGLEDALLQRATWEKAAGEHLARHVTPAGRRDGALLLDADSPRWLDEAQRMRLQLVPRLQAEGLEVDRLIVRLAPDAARPR